MNRVTFLGWGVVRDSNQIPIDRKIIQTKTVFKKFMSPLNEPQLVHSF